MPVPLYSNEHSEHNESVRNVSEIEEDQTNNNLIEDNFDDTNLSFIEPTSQKWTSSTNSSSFLKKKCLVGLGDVYKAALDFFSKKKRIILMKKMWIYVFLKAYYQTCDL